MLKDAAKTIGIIWGVLSSIVFTVLVIVASSLAANKEGTVQNLIENSGMSEAEALAATEGATPVLFIFAFVALASGVYAVILATFVYRTNLTRLMGIIFGAVGIALGVLVPGVLFIIDSVKSRPVVLGQEVEKPEEKDKEDKEKPKAAA